MKRGIRMLDGTYCRTVNCTRHTNLLRETRLMQETQVADFSAEDRLFLVQNQFDRQLNTLPLDAYKAVDTSVWWHCSVLEHPSWQQSKHARLGRGSKCPYCSGARFVPKSGDFETTDPALAQEWHPHLNGELRPSDIARGNPKKFWWLCPKGHAYQASPYNRAVRGRNCSTCRNYRAVPGISDLLSQAPNIAAELHPTKNSGISAAEIVVGSHRVLWWRCLRGHEWRTSVKHRTEREQGCARCAGASSSAIESHFRSTAADSLDSVLPESKNRLELAWRKQKYMTVDILGSHGGRKVAIEYDGEFYHRGSAKVEVDMDKTRALLAAGYCVVRVRESPLPQIPLQHERLLQVAYKSNGDRGRHGVAPTLQRIAFWLESLGELADIVD